MYIPYIKINERSHQPKYKHSANYKNVFGVKDKWNVNCMHKSLSHQIRNHLTLSLQIAMYNLDLIYAVALASTLGESIQLK